MSKRQFIAVLFQNKFNQMSSGELRKDERVIVFDEPWKRSLKNPFWNFMYGLYFGRKFNKIIQLPWKEKVWGRPLENFPWEEDTEYYILLSATTPATDPSYFAELKKKHNIKYFMFLGLLPDNPSAWTQRRLDIILKAPVDYVFTNEPRNIVRYPNFIFHSILYSMPVPKDPVSTEWDMCYAAAGGDKVRLDMFHRVYDSSTHSGVTGKYRITGAAKENQIFKNKDEILYMRKDIPYAKIVEEVKKSNCILEIIHGEQTGESFRYYEAVCYNKKLLTTNKNAVNLPFYNPAYIHIFEKPEDIDWEWVKERTPIEYGYDGRYSPSHMFDEVVELEERKKKTGQ